MSIQMQNSKDISCSKAEIEATKEPLDGLDLKV